MGMGQKERGGERNTPQKVQHFFALLYFFCLWNNLETKTFSILKRYENKTKQDPKVWKWEIKEREREREKERKREREKINEKNEVFFEVHNVNNTMVKYNVYVCACPVEPMLK